MKRYNNILSDFVVELYSTEKPEKMFLAFQSVIRALGFDHLSYTYMPAIVIDNPHSYPPVFQLSDGYDEKFIAHYGEANFAEIDYTVSAILDGDMRVKNWWQDAENGHLSKREQHVIEVARYDYGIFEGVTIPTYGDGQSVAGVSISTSDGSANHSLFDQNKTNILKIISIMYSDRLLGMSSTRSIFESPFLKILSATERKVLALLSKGYTLQEIAHLIQLDYKYISNKVLPSARRKLGEVSRDRMMYYVGMLTVDALSENNIK